MTSYCPSLVFLALVVWREARGESSECMQAVAHSVLNRVYKPSWWGDCVMTVIFKKWQYSSMTDPNDKQLTTWPDRKSTSWTQALIVSDLALRGITDHPAPGADSYHDISIPAPYWATSENFVRQIGRIKFYNVDLDTENGI